uniref:Uncharacterized protein n=1 Tax=Anguilla anguilla TaxID=7936 RepID=A0A0E9T6H6_ANGAN
MAGSQRGSLWDQLPDGCGCCTTHEQRLEGHGQDICCILDKKRKKKTSPEQNGLDIIVLEIYVFVLVLDIAYTTE